MPHNGGAAPRPCRFLRFPAPGRACRHELARPAPAARFLPLCKGKTPGIDRNPSIASTSELKLHLDQPANFNAITAYGPDYVQVNQTRHTAPLVVMPQQLIEAWRPQSFEDLKAEDFAELARLPVEIILLGTGDQLRFPHPKLTRTLMEKRIGLETMSTAAACRTYNILMGEGRAVACALLLK